MISKAVLEYLTQGGKKRPVVLIGFHQYRCFVAAQIGGSLIAQPVLAKVQDEQGVERVSPVPGEWQTEEHMRGRLIRASEGIYALEYVSYNHPAQATSALPREEISVRLFLDWSTVSEIHLIEEKSQILQPSAC